MENQIDPNDKGNSYLEFSHIPDILTVHPVEFLYLTCYSIYDVVVNESIIVEFLLSSQNLEEVASWEFNNGSTAKDVLENLLGAIREVRAIVWKGFHYKGAFQYGELTYDDSEVIINKRDKPSVPIPSWLNYSTDVLEFAGMYPVDVLKSIYPSLNKKIQTIFRTFKALREHPDFDSVASANIGRADYPLLLGEWLDNAFEYAPKISNLWDLVQQYIYAYDRGELTYDEEEYRRQNVRGYADEA